MKVMEEITSIIFLEENDTVKIIATENLDSYIVVTCNNNGIYVDMNK